MRIGIVANCQGTYIQSFFAKSLEANGCHLLPLVDVHTVNAENKATYLQTLKQADLIVSQPILHHTIPEVLTRNIRERNQPVIVFPSLYFDAYFPQVTRSPAALNNTLLNMTCDWYIFSLWFLGVDATKAREFILDVPLFSEEETRTYLHTSIANLRSREEASTVDVPMSDFYAQSYGAQRLHNTFNHPAKVVMDELAVRLGAKLGYEIHNSQHGTFGIGRLQHPVCPAIHRHLGLTFPSDPELYYTAEGPRSLVYVLRALWSDYASRPDISEQVFAHKNAMSILQRVKTVTDLTVASRAT